MDIIDYGIIAIVAVIVIIAIIHKVRKMVKKSKEEKEAEEQEDNLVQEEPIEAEEELEKTPVPTGFEEAPEQQEVVKSGDKTTQILHGLTTKINIINTELGLIKKKFAVTPEFEMRINRATDYKRTAEEYFNSRAQFNTVIMKLEAMMESIQGKVELLDERWGFNTEDRRYR